MARMAYTMQEMRDIVNYLVERRAYGETKGRSMWVNFAESGRTKRTWQSLKETFIKRILPDIHNPYFKLTKDQIASFRAGDDKTQKSSNHLDFEIVGETSRASDKDTLPPAAAVSPATAIGEERHTKSNCTHERVGNHVDEDTSQSGSPSKSLQDLILYKDPLTPMMSIIHDWDSDSDRLESEHKKSTNTHSMDSATTPSAADTSSLLNNQEDRASGDDKNKAELKPSLKQPNNKTSKKQNKVRLSDAVSQNSSNSSKTLQDVSQGNLQDISPSKDSEKDLSVEQLLRVLTDTILPNNPEGFEVLSKFLNSQVLSECENVSVVNKNVDKTTKLIKTTKQSRFKKGTTPKDVVTKIVSDNSDSSLENITPNALSYTIKDKETFGIYSSVEELLLKLIGSDLPSNQKEWLKNVIIKAQKSNIFKKRATDNDTRTNETTQEFLDQSLDASADRDTEKPKYRTRQAKKKSANEKSHMATKSTNKEDSQRAIRSTRNKSKPCKIDCVRDSNSTLSLIDDNERTPSPATVNKSVSPHKQSKKAIDTNIENILISEKHPDEVVPYHETSEADPRGNLVSSDKNEDQISKRLNNQEQSNTSQTQSQLEEELRKILESPTSSEKSALQSGSQFVAVTEKTDSNLDITNPCLRSANLFESDHQEPLKTETFKGLEHGKNSPSRKDSPVLTPQKRKTPPGVESDKVKSPKTDSCSKLSSDNNRSDRAKSPGIVMLASHSTESESSTEPLHVQRSRTGTHRALPQLFGFANGNSRRTNRPTKRKHNISERSSDSDSSDRDPGDQYVRISKNKPLYVRRPASGRVQTLSDGSLVAVVGGKVYGVVDHRGNRVYSLKLRNRGGLQDNAINEEPIRLSSDSSAKASRRNSSRTSRDSGISRHREPARIGTVTPVATAPVPQTSLTLTKDSVTFTGDVEKLAALLPQLQQMVCGLRAPASADRSPAKNNELTGAEIRARVEAREAQIFREIEQRDKNERQPPLTPRKSDKDSTSPRQSETRERGKDGATLPISHTEQKATEARRSAPRKKAQRQDDAKQEADTSRTQKRSRGRPKKLEQSTESEREIVLQDDQPAKKMRTRKTEPSVSKPTNDSIEIDSDSETLYALPTGRNRARNMPGRNVPMDLFVDESSQGYQQTDESLLVVKPKRRRTYIADTRRRSSVSLASKRYPRRSRRPSLKALLVVSSDEEGVPPALDPHMREIPDVDTPRLTPVQEQVDSIDLTTNTGTPDVSITRENSSTKLQMNSSNVSLPPSPEISIVENICVSSTSIYQPELINQRLDNDGAGDGKHVSVMFEDVNMSCPLMEQDLAITGTKSSQASSSQRSCRSSADEMEICLTTLDEHARANPTVTESLLSKVNDVRINETTESMQNELNNLRLTTFANSPKPKPGRKTRCSTPNKKPKQRRSRAPTVACVTEEEHVEKCSRVRTRSHPGTADLMPDTVSQTFIQLNQKENVPSIVVTDAEAKPIKWKIRKPRAPKPKVIKVKILKPKHKDMGRKRRHTADFLQISSGHLSGKENSDPSANTNMEWTHNHTDTCAATTAELINGSGHFGDTTRPTDLTYTETTQHSQPSISDSGVALMVNTLSPSPDVFDEDARDATDAADTASTTNSAEDMGLSHFGSLLTEDYESANSWFLFSEEEDENHMQSVRRQRRVEEQQLREKYGSHIASLYPLACAVPHLSTVIEASDSNPSSGSFFTCPASPASPKAHLSPRKQK